MQGSDFGSVYEAAISDRSAAEAGLPSGYGAGCCVIAATEFLSVKGA